MRRLFANYLSLENFYHLAHRWSPIFGVLSFLLLTLGLYLGFFYAPPDYQQGEVYRIIYIHVPCAYVSMLTYVIMSVMGLMTLVFRLKIAALLMDACIGMGTLFCFLALITGSLWGKPMWGTFWIWDARLTSELILLIWYLLLMSLKQAIHANEHGTKIRAVLVLVGSINLPIIHFSVQWWNTLHQGSTLSSFAKPSIDTPMLYPLLIMIIAMTCYVGFILLIETKRLILEKEKRKYWLNLSCS